jgi:FdhD protein
LLQARSQNQSTRLAGVLILFKDYLLSIKFYDIIQLDCDSFSVKILKLNEASQLQVFSKMSANKPIQFIQVDNDEWHGEVGHVIRETPVSLTINGEVWLTFMCTPIDLEALAVGFLFNEGLVETSQEIEDVRVCPAGDNIDVWTRSTLQRPDQWRRTSGCTGGVTSVDSNENQPAPFIPVIRNGGLLTPEQVNNLISELFKAQDLYRQTGGVHTSTLTDGEGTFVSAEDIGRHNTLDKIAGRCLMENIHFKRRIIVTTGRISSEMMQKSTRLGAAVVISRTSPSSLSIKLAEENGITLIGYARRNRFNIYTHHERIQTPNLSHSHPLEIYPTTGQKNETK